MAHGSALAQSPVSGAPLDLVVYTASSVATADALHLDVDVANLDVVSPWTIRYVDVRGPAPLGSLLVLEAGVPGFFLDSGGGRIEPGAVVTGSLPIPAGIAHLDLTIQVHAVDEAGEAVTVQIPMPAASVDAVLGKPSAELSPGPISAKQQTFLAVWGSQAGALPTKQAQVDAYHALKRQKLAPAAGEVRTYSILQAKYPGEQAAPPNGSRDQEARAGRAGSR